MKNATTRSPIAAASRHARRAISALAVLAIPAMATAAEAIPPLAEAQDAGRSDAPAEATDAEAASPWSLNFTPVLVLPKGDYRLGGGTDPELKYTHDLGGARLSVGGRVGAYYAKNLFGVTLMPTLRLMVPLGPVEPYVSLGAGYGWLPKIEHEGLATMSRLGVVFRFSDSFAIGVEGTLQQVHGSNFEFPSFGSMMSFNL